MRGGRDVVETVERVEVVDGGLDSLLVDKVNFPWRRRRKGREMAGESEDR